MNSRTSNSRSTAPPGPECVLERRGVRVLLLATAGIEDTYHIARGPRLELYNAQYRKPAPLVERKDVIGVGGRLDSQGGELVPLDEAAVRQAARRAAEEGYGAVAVGFLFSYKNPSHELRAREILIEELGEDFTVSLSHEAAKEWREYERTSSAVVEAYTGPVVRNYLLDWKRNSPTGAWKHRCTSCSPPAASSPPSPLVSGRCRRCFPARSGPWAMSNWRVSRETATSSVWIWAALPLTFPW